MWRTQRPVEEQQMDDADQRNPASRCDSCRTEHGPFVFFQYRGHYCLVCAPAVYNATKLPSGGNRADDLQFPSVA